MQFPADLATFTEEILNGKLHFLYSVTFWYFVDFLYAFSNTEYQNKWTVFEVRFDKTINYHATFTWVHIGDTLNKTFTFWFAVLHILDMWPLKSRLLSVASPSIFSYKLFLKIISSHANLQKLFPFPRVTKWNFLRFKTKKFITEKTKFQKSKN